MSLLRSLAKPPDWDDACHDEDITAELLGPEECIYARHKVCVWHLMHQFADFRQDIRRLMTRVQGHSHLYNILVHIKIILFAKDWNSHVGPNSRKFKQNFLGKTFMAQVHRHAEFAAVPADEQLLLLTTRYKDEFKKWKWSNEAMITGRNRLLDLYNMVRASYDRRLTLMVVALVYQQFGAGVLIDPAWHIDYLTGHCSPGFGEFIAGVGANFAEAKFLATPTELRPLVHTVHEHTSQVLLMVVRTLGDEDNAQSVHVFLRDNPPDAVRENVSP